MLLCAADNEHDNNNNNGTIHTSRIDIMLSVMTFCTNKKAGGESREEEKNTDGKQSLTSSMCAVSFQHLFYLFVSSTDRHIIKRVSKFQFYVSFMAINSLCNFACMNRTPTVIMAYDGGLDSSEWSQKCIGLLLKTGAADMSTGWRLTATPTPSLRKMVKYSNYHLV